MKLKKKLCLVYAKRLSFHNTAKDFPTALLQIIEIWPGQQSYKKNENCPKKSICLVFETEKGQKFVWELPTAFFPGTDKNFKLVPNFSKIYQNLPKKKK
jgi:hypothetical protein